jgi:hypothetical protein
MRASCSLNFIIALQECEHLARLTKRAITRERDAPTTSISWNIWFIQPNQYINVQLEKKLAESKLAYESEIEFLKSEIDENEKKFTAYKERAQIALKRISKDEHDIKKKAQDLEDSIANIEI